MEVVLKRIDNDFHFEGMGNSSVPVHIDAAEGIGGHNAGARPMELLLMGIGGCTAIDVILILKKQRQEITSFKAEVEGERVPVGEANPFKTIHVVFFLEGPINEDKAARAAKLSFEKYCSVSKTLEPTATILYKVVLNGVELAN